MSPIRLSKIICLFIVGFYMLLVVFNNLTDYDANFAFVSNVMSMNDTFSESPPAYRTIKQEGFHHFFYAGIILCEALISFFCLRGTVQLWKHRQANKASFGAAKKWGIYGLTLGLCLWYLGFIAMGGEWFLMWQSQTFNGNPTAFRNSILFTGMLIHLAANND